MPFVGPRASFQGLVLARLLCEATVETCPIQLRGEPPWCGGPSVGSRGWSHSHISAYNMQNGNLSLVCIVTITCWVYTCAVSSSTCSSSVFTLTSAFCGVGPHITQVWFPRWGDRGMESQVTSPRLCREWVSAPQVCVGPAHQMPHRNRQLWRTSSGAVSGDSFSIATIPCGKGLLDLRKPGASLRLVGEQSFREDLT